MSPTDHRGQLSLPLPSSGFAFRPRGTNSSHHEKVGTDVFDSVAQAGSGPFVQGRRSDHLPVLPQRVATEPLRTKVFLLVNILIRDIV